MSVSESRVGAVEGELQFAGKWRVLAAVCLGLGMLMIDNFIVNVALPTISRSLNAQLDIAEWTVSAYVLALGVLPLAMGRMGDIFGRKRVYVGGLVVFVAASALCGSAHSIEQLVAYRTLQGIGASVMMPGTLAIVTSAFPQRQRGLAIGIWGGVSGLGLVAGPLLGGLLVRGDSWRWIFYVNLPLGLLALVMTALWVRESRDERAARGIDWLGVVLVSGGLLVIMLAFNRANGLGWTSSLVLGGFGGGALLLSAFLVWEQRVSTPLLDIALFRSPALLFSCLSAFLFSATAFGSQPFLSLYMQNLMGFSPLQGGLAFIPATALVAVLMPFSGIIGQKLGGRVRFLLIFASLCVVASALYLLRLSVESGYVDGLLPSFLLRGLGIGLFMSASSLAVVSSVPAAKAGLASGALTMSRNVGTAMGVAIFGAVFLHHVDATVPAAVPAANAIPIEQVRGAAEHFLPLGQGSARAAVAAVIVDGFVRIAVATAILSIVAAIASLFIRVRRAPSTSVSIPATAPVVTPKVEVAPGS